MLGSLAAMGSAFVGTKVYPIQKGGDPLAGPALLGATITGAFAAAKKAVEPEPEPLKTETVPIDQLYDYFAKKLKQQHPDWSDDAIDKLAKVSAEVTKKRTKEKPVEKMNSYELENFRNKLSNELNKEKIAGNGSMIDVTIKGRDLIFDIVPVPKSEEEIKPAVTEQSPLEQTTTQTSPTDISSSSEPPPEATGDITSELNETTQSVPSEGGKRKVPFWFKHSGKKH